MSILNVNQIQPVGGGNTITVSASDVNFSGNISVGSSFIGIVTASTATLATISQGLTGTPDITVNNIQSGIVTATTFIGDGSGITGVTASGSGINIKDSNSTVGVAATVDFGTNLNVSPASAGIVTVTVGDTDFAIADKIVHTGDTNTAIRFPADDTVTVETSGSERLRITSDGNIGINTTNPTSYANSQATLVIEDDTNPAICISDTGQARDWWLVGQGDGLSLKYADGGGSGSVSNVTSAAFFKNNGNFGIGTNNPERLLSIKGSNAMIQLEGSGGNGKQWSIISSDDVTGAAAASGPGNFVIYDDSSGGLGDVLTLTGVGGSMGLGVQNPGAKLHVSGGNIKVDSGYGIDFSATADGSGTMTSELLDDYEEGTWTPIFDTSISGGTLSGITYNLQQGKYRKIGSVVYIEGLIRTSSITNGGAGTYDISGLPFNAANTDTNGVFFCYSQHTWTNAPHHFGVVANTDHARARGGISVGDATYTNGNTNDFNTGSGSKNRVYFSGWYTTT